MKQSSIDLPALDFLRVAAVVPALHVADISYNTQVIIEALVQAAARGYQLALLPELCITGYSCADLFSQSLLLDQARSALQTIARAAGHSQIAAIVGLPLEVDGKLYNCAAFLNEQRILGLVPKTYLPTTNEYYEERWFSSSNDCSTDAVRLDEQMIPFGADLLFSPSNVPHGTLGIEICQITSCLKAEACVSAPPQLCVPAKARSFGFIAGHIRDL